MQTPWGDVITRREQSLAPHDLFNMRVAAAHRRRSATLGALPGGLDPAALFSAVRSGASSLATPGSGIVQRIEVRSQVSPTYVYDASQPGAPPSQSAPSNWLMEKLIVPEVIVYGPGGAVLYDYAPYGKPVPEKYFWALMGAAGIGGAIGGYFLFKGVAASFKRRPALAKNPRRARRRSRARRAA